MFFLLATVVASTSERASDDQAEDHAATEERPSTRPRAILRVVSNASLEQERLTEDNGAIIGDSR